MAMLGNAAAPAAITSLSGLGLGNSGWSNQTSQGTSFGLGGSNSASSGYEWSNAYGYGTTDEYGYSNNESYGYSNNSGYGYNNSDAFNEGWSEGSSQGYSEEYNRTFGREASAQDILNAREANAVQRDLWSDQATYNAEQAAIDRAFQAYMSNTSYQRAVADLRAAGLNPILAAGNMGASTPVGSAASAGLATSAKANAYAESYGTGYSRSNSANKSYNYGTSKGRSENWSSGKSENWSSGKSENWKTGRNENWSNSEGRNQSNSSSWEKSGSQNTMQAASEWTNNIREILGAMTGAAKDMFGNVSSAVKAAQQPAYKISNNYTERTGGNYKSGGYTRDMMGNIVGDRNGTYQNTKNGAKGTY